jgi:hypothetical protein
LPTSSPKTQPKFQSPTIIVGQYLIHIHNPLVLNYGVRSINYLKRRLFPSRCLGCGQGICPCHQATAIAALALLTSSIQIAFPLRHLHHRHPVNRLPRSTSASAFGATTPPSTAHPTPCLFLYDAAEEGFQGLRHGEVPRRLELARGQHGGWGGGGVLDLLYPSRPPGTDGGGASGNSGDAVSALVVFRRSSLGKERARLDVGFCWWCGVHA